MELSAAGRAANKEDWNKFLMAAKVRSAMSSEHSPATEFNEMFHGGCHVSAEAQRGQTATDPTHKWT